ncbi:MAG: DUF4173 domain-containing protein [Gaiellaceae bacterium]
MSDRTRLGFGLLGAALVLGVLGDELLRATPIGINLFLWVAALSVTLVLLARWRRSPLTGGRRWMLPALLLFAALPAWRDSNWLLGLDLLAIAAALALGALRTRKPVHRAGLADYVVGLGSAGAAVSGRAATLMQSDIEWRELPKGPQARQAVAVGRGFLLAAPLLLLFGALFVAADKVFQGFVTDAVPNGEELVSHTLLIVVFAWVAAGLLREYLVRREPLETDVRPSFTLGGTEVAVVLGLLNLLFLAFVLVQLRYLFGGASLVAERTDLTYAEYARHGFFELVAVAALVLPLLLLGDWLLRRERRRDEVVFRVLAGALLVLLAVVMGSALERMRLYQREYGLTELRVYATGFMVWLAVVLGWAATTVLRSRRDLFAVGALASGFAAIFAMNALNPDALIARTNLERPNLDVAYLTQLSDDATPALVDALPTLDPKLRAQLELELAARRDGDDDWRTWNWSRSRAQAALEDVP